jgi:hypothetical protein
MLTQIKFMNQNYQKGVALLTIFFVVTTMLAVILGIGGIVSNKVKLLSDVANSRVMFYAADTGVEKTFYYNAKFVPNGASRGFCNICNSCTSDGGNCTNCTTTALGSNGCDLVQCNNCEVTYDSSVNGKNYSVDARVIPSMPANSYLGYGDMGFGNGLFLALNDGDGFQVMTSPDATTWTGRSTPNNSGWSGVTFGNNQYVATGSMVTGNGAPSNDSTNDATRGKNDNIMYSSDAINWNLVANGTIPLNDSLAGVAYGNGTFVAIPSDTWYSALTSSDGVSWTQQGITGGYLLNAVTYGNNLFVAVGSNVIMTSPDGITWTTRTSPASNTWVSVVYGNNLFVAVSQDGVGNRIMTSPDGINWTVRSSPSNAQWMSVTYGGGTYVAVACGDGSDTSCGGTTNQSVMTSSNGTTWTLQNAPTDDHWVSITYGNNLFVASGLNSMIMKSSNGTTWTDAAIDTSSLFYFDITSKGTFGGSTRVVQSNSTLTPSNQQQF